MIKKIKDAIQKKLSGIKIKRQLFLIYFITAFLPLLIIGGYLLVNNFRYLNQRYMDLVYADNTIIKATLSELTTQTYKISNELVADKKLSSLIAAEYTSPEDFQDKISSYGFVENYTSDYAEIDSIRIYTDNPNIGDYRGFYKLTDEIRNTDWYCDIKDQYKAVWTTMYIEDRLGSGNWRLSLVRRIPLINSDYLALISITVSDNYIKMFTDNEEYRVFIAVEDTICYSSDLDLYGRRIETDKAGNIVLPEEFRSNGLIRISEVEDANTFMSDSRIYIYTESLTAATNIWHVLVNCFFIIVLSSGIPGVLMYFYNIFFSGRVNILREEIHKVSTDNLVIRDSFQGGDELSDAFKDVKNMVEKIKETKMLMYEAKIKEQDLINEQRVMELKILSNQINPHFLYNTLGTFHMKALKANDREVADGIITLSQIMRYVLGSNQTNHVSLEDEIKYVTNYLQLQQMRFGNKILNYSIMTDPDFDIKNYFIPPLLLQPVVENAILHGMDKLNNNGLIEIEINKKEYCIEILITDNGSGIDEDILENIRETLEQSKEPTSDSIGILNVNKRIKLFFGEEYGISIFSKKGKGTSVLLHLPPDSRVNELHKDE